MQDSWLQQKTLPVSFSADGVRGHIISLWLVGCNRAWHSTLLLTSTWTTGKVNVLIISNCTSQSWSDYAVLIQCLLVYARIEHFNPTSQVTLFLWHPLPSLVLRTFYLVINYIEVVHERLLWNLRVFLDSQLLYKSRWQLWLRQPSHRFI